ncbi:multidrug resistance-associated protein 5 [Tanacetum coccineum]
MKMGKDQVFTVNLHHEYIFNPSPLRYQDGDEKQITDIDFVRVGYENKWYINLYVEHFDYDIMDFIKEEANVVLSSGSSDEYYSNDEIEEFDEVDFHIEGDENVLIMKYINVEAYKYLVERNLNSWCRAFFNLDVKCAAFENRISESYYRAILLQRSKPIITMLEEIRIYIMQRLVGMQKLAVNLEDQITPTVRKRLECLKQEQRHWIVHPSGYEELEVRCGDQAYGVNLRLRKCVCRLRQLSGAPCIHVVAGTNNQPPLPPIVRKMPGRPRKKRVKAAGENNFQVTRLGKQIRCSNYQGVGHNKATCENPHVPKPITDEVNRWGRGSRGGGKGAMGVESGGRGADSGGRGVIGAESEVRGAMGAESEGIGAMDADSRGRGAMDADGGGRGAMDAESGGRGAMGSALGGRGTDSSGRGTMGGGRGKRGGGRGRRGGGRRSNSGLMEVMIDPSNDFIFPELEESMDVEMYNRTKASKNFNVNPQKSVTHGQPSYVEAASVQPAESVPAFAEGPSVQVAQAVNVQPASDNA